MRWASLCMVLGAAWLPAISARPLCRPDQSTTALTTTSVASSTATTSSMSTPIVATTTSGIQTTTSETSVVTPTTTPSTTPTTPSSTPTPTPENLVINGNFEEDDVSVWNLRTVTIEADAAKAHSPVHYVRYYVDDEFAIGGNQLNQTINGLDVTRLYRLSFSAAVFGMPQLGSASCSLEALQENTVFKSWNIDTSVLNQYKTYTTDFLVDDEDITFTLRLRCTSENKVTIDIGVDDIVINDIGQAHI